jgi:hypothetical protein
MSTIVRLLSVAVLVAATAAVAASSAVASPSRDALTASSRAALAFTRAPSPELVRQAVRAGTIDEATGLVYLARALFARDQLPAEYQSDTPFHGTIYLLEIQRGFDTLSAAQRDEVESLVGSQPSALSFFDVGPGLGSCDLAPLPSTHVRETAHFYIEYNEPEVNNSPDGLTIDDYADSLEHAWAMEITSFKWAKPPVGGALPAPNGKYLVKIQQLSPVLYGFVSNTGTSAGFVGDNPNTPWNDQDADASCMGLNSDYVAFPGSPRRALDATTAHEFNHSIQFGIGALAGANTPDSAYIEGGATWMEDEAYDYANDNYNYLWPVFEMDMGEYTESPYPYWITFRGLTERFGSSKPGRGEDVMQRFWELTSQNTASNLQALDLALQQTKGITLPQAYHDYAVAVKINENCRKGFGRPWCLEEGRQYVNGDGVQTGAGETAVHGTISAVGGSFSGSIPDNYALNWVALPSNAMIYSLTLRNDSTGGNLRATLGCHQGSRFTVKQVTTGLGAGQSATVPVKWAQKCDVSQFIAITNVAQTAANPSASTARAYMVSTS